ncbi:MAG TPA: fasciclin domain-containing protein [Bradyrhizobium sp.]|nr:fasciclin domain-containing protein [Bradyrhizobium sp.]
MGEQKQDIPIGAKVPARARFAINGQLLTRFCKYLVLLIGVLSTLTVVFDAYSFYVARRDIDAELRSKKVSSIEYLNLLLQRERALTVTTLEGRCVERLQLTMFRIFNAEHDAIYKVYRELIEKKNGLIEIVQRLGPGLVNVEKAANFLDGIHFDLSKLDEQLEPLSETLRGDPKYRQLKEEISSQREKYAAVALANISLRERAEQIIRGANLDDSKYWNMDAIRALAGRIDQLREERKQNSIKFSEVEDIVARYNIWIGALTGGVADSALADDVAYRMGKADAVPLKDQDCKGFDSYYGLVTERIRSAQPLLGKNLDELSWGEMLGIPKRAYRQYLLTYFQQPPAAQTLFVTLFLGALGALALNMLRMSSVGWWANLSDPRWGEIVVGPVLGALSAFGIFLIGSAGLLLTSDTNGAQPLSTYFIGLLGFLSGLMYDEAFARVRRIGTEMFAAKPSGEAVNARPEDRSLAEVLSGKGASLAAGLILKYGIGTQVSLESEFTLLIPSDEAVGGLTFTTWTKLNDPQADLFGKWYHKHHCAKRIAQRDAVGDTAAAPIKELVVDDGTSYSLLVNDSGFQINNVRVLIADVIWKKGIIHILAADFR